MNKTNISIYLVIICILSSCNLKEKKIKDSIPVSIHSEQRISEERDSDNQAVLSIFEQIPAVTEITEQLQGLYEYLRKPKNFRPIVLENQKLKEFYIFNINVDDSIKSVEQKLQALNKVYIGGEDYLGVYKIINPDIVIEEFENVDFVISFFENKIFSITKYDISNSDCEKILDNFGVRLNISEMTYKESVYISIDRDWCLFLEKHHFGNCEQQDMLNVVFLNTTVSRNIAERHNKFEQGEIQ